MFPGFVLHSLGGWWYVKQREGRGEMGWGEVDALEHLECTLTHWVEITFKNKREWEGSWGETGYMCIYGWVPLLFTWNYLYIVNQLSLLFVCVLSHVWLFCDPMNCCPPGSSDHGIFQARILEWVAISCPRGSSGPRDRTHISWVSCIGRQILYPLSHLGSPIQNKKLKERDRIKEKIAWRYFYSDVCIIASI